ncbi:helix-turn-helix transcriptional regulator [Paenibacillus sp. GD4]|uniref:helix-turn-helix transcriptional regulator n=1 Tax=Paenibacillus sp. GD4 TaxID=3068890 RepID=UPI002796AC0C|nr:helix-turn-helix transcriptional regulator [Paenibacillus sp. GD4]MDQ1909149.1 helix-turn-helix transcriptional regulator [Paenibacillus sp. GD4]
MSQGESYTTEELAKLLRISKLTVYDLIKRGELPAYRVGRQMRVDAVDLEAYKARAKGGRSAGIPASVQQEQSTRSIVITGQDMSLDLLCRQIEKKDRRFRPLRSYASSMDSLISLYQGQADIVSCHLLDGDTGEYNLPYVRRLLVGHSYAVIHMLSRYAGLYVAKGNPKGVRSWKDLGRQGLRIVNREKGSGARVLLDEQFRLHGIPASDVLGYESEETNHLGVAGQVATGRADVGVGMEKAAALVGVDFVPLIKERYDLVVMKTETGRELIELVRGVLLQEDCQRELRSVQGYDLTDTGKILYET